MFTLQQIAGSAEFMNHLATRQEQRQNTRVLQPGITTVMNNPHQREKCHCIAQHFEKVGHVQKHLIAKSGDRLFAGDAHGFMLLQKESVYRTLFFSSEASLGFKVSRVFRQLAHQD